jgi:2-isopropylmalate synthase
MFSGLLETVPRLHSAKLSLHAHDNHGRATENALIAIECGALQIEGTINGVGPAGGNTNLVELSGILQQDKFCNQHEIAIDQDQLRSLSGSPLLQPAPATGRPASRI